MSQNTATDLRAQAAPSVLSNRSWASFAMMVHGMIDQVTRVMHDGGLMQPGAAERVSTMRAGSGSAASAA